MSHIKGKFQRNIWNSIRAIYVMFWVSNPSFWSAGPEESVMISKIPSLRWCFLRVCTLKLLCREVQECTNVILVVTFGKCVKVSKAFLFMNTWRDHGSAKTWHGERLEGALGESVVSVAVEAPGRKGSCRLVETWHYVAGQGPWWGHRRGHWSVHIWNSKVPSSC